MAGATSSGESVADCANGLAAGREKTKNREESPVHKNLAIDEDFVLAVAPVLGVDLDMQLSFKLRRHTDGVQTGDSKGAIANNDSGHLYVLRW
jgi:hypothetical protein